MVQDMVMRSVYLRPEEDAQLRQLAFEIEVTKSDLIRSAIGVKLVEWLESGDRELIMRDLEKGRRTPSAQRERKAVGSDHPLNVARSPAKAAAPVSEGQRSRSPKKRGEAVPDVKPRKANLSSGKANTRTGSRSTQRQPEAAL
jgi:hypothetical protein